MKNINRFRAVLGALLITTLVVISLSSCFLFVEPEVEKWKLEGGWGTETWEMTDNTISYFYDDVMTYKAKIVKEVEGQFNSSDTEIVLGADIPNDDYGYMVIRYTYVNNSGTGEVGKYNIFRWQENAVDDDKHDFTQGYKDADGVAPYINVVFSTAAEAEDGATNTNGYFNFTSAGASQVED